MYDQLGYELAKVALQKEAGLMSRLKGLYYKIKNKIKPTHKPPSKSQKVKKFLSKHKLAIGLGVGGAGVGGLYYLTRKKNANE